jgi:hypothetical protein
MSEIEPLGLPGPEPTTTSGPSPENQSKSSTGLRRRIPSCEECLALLAEIAGLLAVNMIRPAQANAMKGVLHEILAFHQRAVGGSQPGAGIDSRLLEMLPQNPELMNSLEPFLSAEQVEVLVQGATNGNRAKT